MRLHFITLATWCGLSLLPALAAGADSSAPLAFPGAQGFAANATGGRGGDVVHVTNLNDSGEGSFREAVKKGHCTVVFDVGGYIPLKSVLAVGSDITIAGQTAPGEGIGTRDSEISFSGSKNVIVRYMRFRQGNVPKQEKKSAVDIYQGSNMIFDHVDIQWGRWDCLDMNKSDNMTFQYCIIGQGVSPQRFGCLCQSQHVTFTHNLWINNQSRNPKAKGTVQYVNNVVYNWGGAGGFVEGHSAADSFDDVVGNYFIAGPSSSKGHAFVMGLPSDKVYSAGNFVDLNLNGILDGRPCTVEDLGNITVQEKPFSTLQLQIDSAGEAYNKVLAGAGCSLHRDAIDQSLIEQVKSLGKEGKIIEDVNDIGGPGEIKGGTAAREVTELKEAGPVDAEGYTKLETYLNDLVK